MTDMENRKTLFNQELNFHQTALDQLKTHCLDDFLAMADAWAQTIRRGNKILFFGNGGSAADAQHLATELSVRYINDRDPIAAMALTTDTSTLTAAGNDYGFDYIFSRQIEAIGKPGDLALGFSTSGSSPNILNALKKAKEMGLIAAGLTGRSGGEMKSCADPLIIVPDQSTARIQEMHITLGHMLCASVEQDLNLI